jgi:hypothetical protein
VGSNREGDYLKEIIYEESSAGRSHKLSDCGTVECGLTPTRRCPHPLHGDFQITRFGPIATPYREEEVIAKVANSYGSRVSTAQVHNDPLTKVYICQTVGYDWRLQSVCSGYLPCGKRSSLSAALHCDRSLIEIDHYGERLIGCFECNRWGLPGSEHLWRCQRTISKL